MWLHFSYFLLLAFQSYIVEMITGPVGKRLTYTDLFLALFLGSSLRVNPEERLSITELVNQLQEIAAARNVNPKSPITEVIIDPVW